MQFYICLPHSSPPIPLLLPLSPLLRSLPLLATPPSPFLSSPPLPSLLSSLSSSPLSLCPPSLSSSPISSPLLSSPTLPFLPLTSFLLPSLPSHPLSSTFKTLFEARSAEHRGT